MNRTLVIEPTGIGEVEFAASSSGSDLLKTVYTDVRCTVVVLYVSAVEEGEKSKEVGLAGVQVFGRHEPAFEAKERYSSSAVTLSNGRFTPDMDELMRRLERKKNTFTEQKSQDEGAMLETGGQTAVSEDVFYKTTRPQKEMEIQREGNKFLEKENTIVPALRDRLNRSDANEGNRQIAAEVDHLPLVPTGEPTEFSRAVELFGSGVEGGN
ncbi:unnamed protein product [Nippostrongylus brasiliensis]|uniref:FACT complex subunit n=1 Tax=Nippostrongylus brasiliensis TaxID=27835 RepID=A0A0N4XH59_NIPBR|nr:unnamed protein product [Nippostrongylus brasiliensis]